MAARPKKGRGTGVDFANKDPQYWRGMFFSAEARRREAWRSFYQELSLRFRSMILARRVLDASPAELKQEFSELVAKADALKRECPVCKEQLTVEAARVTDCGHLLHITCAAALAVCPICKAPLVT
jgi:hypothetical protein